MGLDSYIKQLEKSLASKDALLKQCAYWLKVTVLNDDTTSDQFCDAEEFTNNLLQKLGEK